MSASSTGLLLFSHGSLLCGAGAALDGHAQRLRERGDYTGVEVGYLNYSEPTFRQAVQKLAASRAERIVVAPYFLVPGYFVTTSLPKQIDAVRADYPWLHFRTAASLGADERLADALIASAKAPIDRENWRDGAAINREACRYSAQCPARGTQTCPNGLLGTQGRGVLKESGSEIEWEKRLVDNGSAAPHLDSDTLLVLVHGSPKPEANEHVYAVVEMVRARGAFARVGVGFMECNQPTIPDAVDECVASMAARVIAVPYFLHTGNHVAADLPNAMDAAQRRYPETEFLMGRYLGASPLVTDVLAERAREAVETGQDY